MRVYLFTVLLCIAVFAACRKDYGGMPPANMGSDFRITRTITMDSDYQINKFIYRDFIYDGSNRVIKYLNYEVDSNVANPHADTIHTILFTYHDASVLPSESIENFDNGLNALIGAVHQYSYDAQDRLILDTLLTYDENYPYADLGVTRSRRITYGNGRIRVTNLNENALTGITGMYTDSIALDGQGNPLFIHVLAGRDFISHYRDDYQTASYYNGQFAFRSLSNPFYRLNVKSVLAFVQTGFPGSAFYNTYLYKFLPSNSSLEIEPSLNGIVSQYQYSMDPQRSGRVESIRILRSGQSGHGGYTLIKY